MRSAELDAMPHPYRFGEHADGVADVKRRKAGSLRVILVGDRGAEQRHHAVAGELMHRALEPVHAFGDDLEEVLDDAEPLFWVEPRPRGSSTPSRRRTAR